jgi:SAM-dependent methyltransferase
VALEYDYSGSELELFKEARNWKAYCARQINSYIGRKVLEVGAGIGGTTSALFSTDVEHWCALEPDHEQYLTLADKISSGDLAHACEARHGTLVDVHAGELYDSILYIDVLEHIERDANELQLAASHLAPGGFLVVLVPAHQWLFSAFDKSVGHYRRYSVKQLLNLTPPGADVVHSRYLDSCGIILSLANRLLIRKDLPSEKDIKFWDKAIVPISRVLDPVLGYRLGKTAVVVWQCPR